MIKDINKLLEIDNEKESNEAWNHISSREQLINLLKKYKGILSHEMIDYLKSLIELEFSVIRQNISEIKREALTELELYRKIAIYNIYKRAKRILDLFDNYVQINKNMLSYI